MPSFDAAAFFNQFLYNPKNPLLFNNGFFVFFFTLFISLYYIFRNQLTTRRYIFCFFSLYFFYKASGYFVGLVVVSAIVDFILSNAIYKQPNKAKKLALLLTSIVFNLGMLCYFKYTNFFIELSNQLFHTSVNPLNILLPVGISFYTFENLSYTFDVYKGEFEPAKKFSDYLLFLSFFPKLVMGPIVRAHDFVPQINQPYQINERDFAKGFYLIVSGLFKKLVISDYITLNFVNYIFDAPERYTGLENLMAVYAYAVVIYCDFSGLSDVAIGIAKWLGFNIPTNFLSPYQSKSITEFWRRWHISLSSWLKDYLYIPLGGNRKGTIATWIIALLFVGGVFAGGHYLLHLNNWMAAAICTVVLLLFLLPAIIQKEQKGMAASLNLMATMMLGGFWHGASWNFIIWGSLHGIGLAIHKLWMLLTGKTLKSIHQHRWYKALTLLITFHFVCFCWVFFKAADFTVASNLLHQIYADFNPGIWYGFVQHYYPVLLFMLLAFLLHAIPDDWIDRHLPQHRPIALWKYLVVFFGFLIIYGFCKSAETVLPIYLQF